MTDLRPTDLESHLGYWLRKASNRVSHEFARSLAERGVSVAEWVALRRLYDSASSPSALAGALGMTQGAISKVVDKLQSKGWLDVRGNADDRRGILLVLSNAGREVLPGLAQAADENDERFFGPLSFQDRETLRLLLKRLGEIHGWIEVPTN